MSRLQDLTGVRVGRLVVVARAANDRNNPRWLCKCDCGNERVIYGGHLRRANQQSCGCLRKEKSTTHGLTKKGVYFPEYQAWVSMMGRCYNPAVSAYKTHGARGIRVCARWHNPTAFTADMGPRPSKDHSLDRRDNDGNYEPGNCRWATRKEQMNNRRVSHYITHNGETKTIAEWASQMGVGWHIVDQRIRRGWTAQEAIETPVQKKGRAPCSSS